ncbi:helix-turn-helix domain-containing protein [Pasteurella testudinis]|uniref:helix-turn-helix domain-containing protein n=1 Tax=Pasteurella testudinis TaxID=761 RepID=UPI004058ACEE
MTELVQRYEQLHADDKDLLLRGLALSHRLPEQRQKLADEMLLRGGICYPAAPNEGNGDVLIHLLFSTEPSPRIFRENRFFCKLSCHLDLNEINCLIGEHAVSPDTSGNRADIRPTPELIDAFARLLALPEQPDSIPILAPLIRREIHYWLLRSPLGGMICQAAVSKRHKHRIQRAIEWLQQHFDTRLSVKALAASVQMSQSSFHTYFRRVTNNTPLQFQKQLRLQKARQLMLGGEDAASAAFSVGYESISQFSREYHRYFGNPPVKDILRLSQHA